MFSIGEFSKINRITPKTLRHYEKIGLLIPAWIDEWTGYRYYKAEQLPLIDRILTLKDCGFSLTEIKEILNESESLISIFKKQESEILAQIKLQKERLYRVQTYISHIQGDTTMTHDVSIKPLPAVLAASMRVVVSGYDTFFDIVPKMGDYLKSVDVRCREPFYCFTIFHDGEYKESDIDVEICEAVAKPFKESEKIMCKEIEAVNSAACLMHKGPYSSLRNTYNR